MAEGPGVAKQREASPGTSQPVVGKQLTKNNQTGCPVAGDGHLPVIQAVTPSLGCLHGFFDEVSAAKGVRPVIPANVKLPTD